MCVAWCSEITVWLVWKSFFIWEERGRGKEKFHSIFKRILFWRMEKMLKKKILFKKIENLVELGDEICRKFASARVSGFFD